MSGYVGILDRVALLLRANINDLLDRALSTNKPAVFDEQINQLNGSLDKISICLGEAMGRQTTLAREIEELRAQQAKTDAEIDRLLAMEQQTNDDLKKSQLAALAASRQSTFNTGAEILELKQGQLGSTQQDVAELQEARIKLMARIDTLKAQKGQLLSLIAERKAAEAEGRALSDADVRSRFSPETLIREEKEAMERARGIVAARSSSIGQQIDDILGDDLLQQQLAERRARLQSDR